MIRAVFAVLFFGASFAAAQVAPELAALKGHIVGLRVPYKESDLKFDADKEVTLHGKSSIGSWGTSGLVYLDSIEQDGNSLKVVGKRTTLVWEADGKVIPAIINRPFKATLRMPSSAAEEQKRAFAAVFETAQIAEKINDYWRPAKDFRKVKLKELNDVGETVGSLHGSPVYTVRKGSVDAPVAISAPDPALFPPSLRRSGGGTVGTWMIVDENGDPAVLTFKPQTERDANAYSIVALSQWKFSPAKKDGKPVPVVLAVEINFETR